MLFSLLFILFIMCFINFLIDTRFVAYAFTTFIVGISLIKYMWVHNMNIEQMNKTILIMLSIFIIINYILALIMRNIQIIEMPHMSKKDFIGIISLTILFSIFSGIYKEINLLENILGIIIMLFVFFIVMTIFYEVVKQWIFAYFTFWINYFCGKEKIYENTPIRIKSYNPKYKYGIYLSYHLECIGNKEVKLNKRASKCINKKYDANKYTKRIYGVEGKESFKFTETLKIKESPVFKKIMVKKLI